MTASAGPTVSLPQRIRVYVEPAASFAVDHTGTLGDFIDVPIVEGSAQLTLTQETQNPQHALQDLRDYQTEIIGKKKWSLNFNTPLSPSGIAATQGVTATGGAIGLLLKAMMGGERKGRGSDVATGGWANSATGAVTTGSAFQAGGLLQWVDTAGIAHAREIEAVTSNTVTLKVGLPGIPAAGAALGGGCTYYYTQDPTTTLQFICEGAEAQDRWLAMGGQGTFTLTLPLDGTIPMLAVQLTGTKWLEGDEAAGAATIHGTTLGNATYSNYEPITGHVGRLLVQTTGTATYSGATVDVSSIEFKSGLVMTPITSPSGSEGVLRYRLTRAAGTAPVEGTFQTYFTGYGSWDARDTKAAKAIAYQNGVTLGKTVLVTAPSVQFTDVQRADASNAAAEVVTYKGRLDEDTTEPTAAATNYDLATSPHRIHLG